MTEPTVRPVPRTRGLGAAVDRLLNEAGPTMPIRDGARVLGCHPNTLYEMEKRGDLAALGIRVLRLGRTKRLVTADLRRAVGVDAGPVTTGEPPKGAA
jgi:hypothetical protein